MDYLRLVPAAWRLQFPRATEKEFIDYYNVTTLSAVRISLAVGVVLFALFGLRRPRWRRSRPPASRDGRT